MPGPVAEIVVDGGGNLLLMIDQGLTQATE
jgi:hypothetical protein